MSDIYYNDYPRKRIGKGNPYYCCSFCGKSDPEINGDITKHHLWCEYRKQKEKENV